MTARSCIHCGLMLPASAHGNTKLCDPCVVVRKNSWYGAQWRSKNRDKEKARHIRYARRKGVRPQHDVRAEQALVTLKRAAPALKLTRNEVAGIMYRAKGAQIS